ncbi:hypothetical protein E8E14_004824 [Neopestalotiopsis sp. 37M]|nr:hypothetical protein E8E14_004824 [Neopestalotiopsis sp. 37M]
MSYELESSGVSREGVCWTPENGSKHGLRSLGTISPSSHGKYLTSTVFDAVIIGAGYAGLVAARDLATRGKKTLLIEARDRVGGRTWSADIDGFQYEMGGTWLHWSMPHIYREISLYGLKKDMVFSQVPGGNHAYQTLVSGDDKQRLENEDADALFSRLWSTFCNIDNAQVVDTIPNPYDSMAEKDAMEKWDKLSAADRLEQIRDQFTEKELAMLYAHLHQMSSGPLDKMGFLDAIRWYAMTGYTGSALNEVGLRTRLGSGQSNLARKIFKDALSSGNLSYVFNAPVARVEDHPEFVAVTTRDGTEYKARRLISTIPLNVLKSISFTPELCPLKQAAVMQGHMGHGTKIHYELAGDELISWMGLAFPGKGTICALADRRTPSGGTHIVSFGPRLSAGGIDLQDEDVVEKLKAAGNHIFPVEPEYKKIVYHDWNADEFACGTWSIWSPEYCTKYLAALQEPAGKIFFASADWSDGYRGWIDGAVQQGTEAAQHVLAELRAEQ